jgi:hypothetical protein
VQATRAYAAASRALEFVEATRALRPVVGRRDALAAMERSALVVALALRDRRAWDAVALLT